MGPLPPVDADDVLVDPLVGLVDPDDGGLVVGAAGAASVPAADPSPVEPVSLPAAGAAAGAAGDDLERLASRASFLAQPEPLNTMAGAERARFIGPPHRSQVAGPLAEIGWITSTTWPHVSQT
ncbi:MAG: hypothetical protein U0667_11560 [Chloroflexota bacterium]